MDLRYYRTADRPALKLWLFDDDGSLINLTGYAFVFKIGDPDQPALLTKNSGITGAAGSGVEPTGVPNVTITWTAGELAAVESGHYHWWLTGTESSLDRVFGGMISILDVGN
jgi:hypothetical protein